MHGRCPQTTKKVNWQLSAVDSHIRTTPNNLHRAKVEIWKNCENITYIKLHTFWADDTLSHLAGVYQREIDPKSDPIDPILVEHEEEEEEESPNNESGDSPDESGDSPHKSEDFPRYSSSGPEPADSIATDTGSNETFPDVFDFALPKRLRVKASDSNDSSPKFEETTPSNDSSPKFEKTTPSD